MRAVSRDGETMGRERGRSRGVGVRSADVGQARVLAPFALTRIQVVWISVWVSLSVCCTFEILRSGRAVCVCARTQKAETIEPAIIPSICIEKIVTTLLPRRIRNARDSYSYDRRMSGGSSPAVSNPPAKVASSLSYVPVSRINFLGSSDSRRRIREDYWESCKFIPRRGISSGRLTRNYSRIPGEVFKFAFNPRRLTLLTQFWHADYAEISDDSSPIAEHRRANLRTCVHAIEWCI